MPVPGVDPLRIHRRERYALGVAKGLSKLDAFVAAGYTGTRSGGPGQVDRQPEVQARIGYLKRKAAAHVINSAAVTRDEITEGVRDTIRLAKKGTPVLAKDGTQTDVCKLDLASANRGFEILAKMNGFMVDVTREDNLDAELEGKSRDELRTIVLALLQELDPNLAKKVETQMDLSDEGEPAEGGETTVSDEGGRTLQ